MSELYEWVNGEQFVAWLDEVRPDHMAELSSSQHRTLYRFRNEGALGSLEVVDAICCALFLHIDEIPEDVWSPVGPNRRKRVDGDKKLRVVDLVEAGVSVRKAAQEVGIHYDTARYWFTNGRAA